MKQLFIVCFAVLAFLSANAQERKYSHFHEQRSDLFEKLLVTPKDAVFIGNSITNGGEWSELFPKKRAKNRGISSDITAGVLDRLDYISKAKPGKVFLMIGVNDVARGFEIPVIVGNMRKIIEKIQFDSPKTKIYLQSLLPVNADFNMFKGHMKPEVIKEINRQYKALAEEYKITYIDLYSHFVEQGTDKLAPKYTNDGLHLMGDGYLLWRDIVLPYL